MNFGLQISLWQQRHRIRSGALAKYFGVHRSVVSRWRRIASESTTCRLILHRLMELDKHFSELKDRTPEEELGRLAKQERARMRRFAKMQEKAIPEGYRGIVM